MAFDAILRRTHRIVAILFFLTVPAAAYASMQGGDPADASPLVYLPLLPLGFLSLTGLYLLVSPWVRRARARKAGAARSGA